MHHYPIIMLYFTCLIFPLVKEGCFIYYDHFVDLALLCLLVSLMVVHWLDCILIVLLDLIVHHLFRMIASIFKTEINQYFSFLHYPFKMLIKCLYFNFMK